MKRTTLTFLVGIILSMIAYSQNTSDNSSTINNELKTEIRQFFDGGLPDIEPDPNFDPCANECFWKIEGNKNIDDNIHFIGPLNGHDFIIKTGDEQQNLNKERVRVDEEGNVAIGRGSNIQRSLFQINDYPMFQNYSGFRFDFDQNQPYFRLDLASGMQPSEVFSWEIKNYNSNPEQIWGALQISSTNGTALLDHEQYQAQVTILQNGNVGIGINKPSEKLSVNGNAEFNGIVYATELIIDHPETFWPDYVFEDDYKLMSLEEVNSFINENGHLPNIPSAEEIQENGINVSQMQIKMMEKIEELTLQMIELDRKNKALESQLNSLSK